MFGISIPLGKKKSQKTPELEETCPFDVWPKQSLPPLLALAYVLGHQDNIETRQAYNILHDFTHLVSDLATGAEKPAVAKIREVLAVPELSPQAACGAVASFAREDLSNRVMELLSQLKGDLGREGGRED